MTTALQAAAQNPDTLRVTPLEVAALRGIAASDHWNGVIKADKWGVWTGTCCPDSMRLRSFAALCSTLSQKGLIVCNPKAPGNPDGTIQITPAGLYRMQLAGLVGIGGERLPEAAPTAASLSVRSTTGEIGRVTAYHTTKRYEAIAAKDYQGEADAQREINAAHKILDEKLGKHLKDEDAANAAHDKQEAIRNAAKQAAAKMIVKSASYSLGKVKTYQARSEETLNFTAELLKDGKAIATVENSGHGGPNNVRPLAGCMEAVAEFEAHCATLPPYERDFGIGKGVESLPMGCDFFLSLMVGDCENLKRAKSLAECAVTFKNGEMYKTKRLTVLERINYSVKHGVKLATAAEILTHLRGADFYAPASAGSL